MPREIDEEFSGSKIAEIAGGLQAANQIDRTEDRAHGVERRGDKMPNPTRPGERAGYLAAAHQLDDRNN